MPLNRHLLLALFKGIEKNVHLQKLILTHEALTYATAGEFQALGAALKSSQSLLLVDFSKNSLFDDNLDYHTEITDCLVGSSVKNLKKIKITSKAVNVKTHYLELKDQRPELMIYNNGKLLKDVDVQEHSREDDDE